MNAKQRYRERLKLRTALTRVLEVIAAHDGLGIPADPGTGLLATAVCEFLNDYSQRALDSLEDGTPAPPTDLKSLDPNFCGLAIEQMTARRKQRRRETKARSGRRELAPYRDHPLDDEAVALIRAGGLTPRAPKSPLTIRKA